MKNLFSKALGTFCVFACFLLFSNLTSAQNLSLSGGNNFSMAVCEDGKIKVWGSVLSANGTSTTVLEPTNVTIPSDLKFSQADAGSGYHVLALDCNSKVWAFGSNDEGQLGYAKNTGSSVPVAVPGINGTGQLSDVSYVSGANKASFAIMSDGRLVSWGENGDGQLGRTTTPANYYIPGYVLKAANTPLTNIVQVDAGDQAVYALDASGYVWSWGSQQDGALGHPGPSSSFAGNVLKQNGTPLTNIIMISGGDKHGLALDADGTVWSWGGNWGRGQLGSGNDQSRNYAAQVVGVGGTGILSNAVYIAAGQASSMVVLRDGRVVSFGSNALWEGSPLAVGGNLGQGTTSASYVSLSPNYVLNCDGSQLTNIGYVSDADAVTYAITRNGEVYVMGGNISGELGLGNTTPVGCATKLDLGVKYSCGIPDQCPNPYLGPDIPICNPTELANTTISTPYYRSYSYKWYFRANDSTSFIELTTADTNIHKPTRMGQYMVRVERISNTCTSCQPGYDTITVDQPGTNATFCKLTNNQLNFSVEGNGIYKWYKSQLGNDSLPARGKTQVLNINDLAPVVTGEDSVYSLYVEDLRTYAGTVGPLQNADLGANPYPADPGTPRSGMKFNVYNTSTINAVWLRLINYGGQGNYGVTLQILDPSGNPVSSFTNTLSIPGTTNPTEAIRFPLGASGITLDKGTGYTIRLLSTTNGNIRLALFPNANLFFPITSTGDIADRISITGPQATDIGTNYQGFLNWEITSKGGGFPCGRLKVSLTKNCPCKAPQIVLSSSTNAYSFCDNGSVASLTLTATPNPATPPFDPFNYRYQWYKNGTLITPGGEQNTISVTSTTGIATYSIRVGHTSVLRSRCYKDTTFSITLQKPIGNNMIAGTDTVCQGNVPNQLTGVGIVTGGVGTTSYQWVSSTTGTRPWTSISQNGTGVDYSPNAINQSTFFRRVVTSFGVCPIDTSNIIGTYVSPRITPGTLVPSASTVCEGSIVAISTTPASGGITPYKYRWEVSSNGNNWSAIGQETNENLVNPIPALTQTTHFRRVVASALGGCDSSARITIVVDKKVTGNSIVDASTEQICEGSAASIIVGSTPGDNGKPATYQWLSSPNATGPFTVLPNANDKDYSSGILTSTTYYKRVVTSSGVCKNDTSSIVKQVKVDPAVTAGTIVPALPTICNGTSPIINKGVSPTGGTPSFTYTWQYSLDGNTWIDISGYTGEGPLTTAPAITGTAQYRRTVNSLVCKATTTASTINVTGQMLPGSIQVTDTSVCPNQIPRIINSLSLASGGTGNNITYQWQSSPDGNAWADVSSAVDTSYTPAVGLTVDTYFRRRATNGNGNCDTVFAGPVLIKQYQPLNPGSIESKDTTVCIGSTIVVHSNALPTNGSPNKEYRWVVSYEPYTSFRDTAINTPTFTVANIQRGMMFKRIVKDDCITGDTSLNTYKVNVLKKTIPSITLTKDLTQVYCNSTDLTVTVSVKNAGPNRIIDWVYNNSTRRPIPDSILTLSAGELFNGALIQVVVTSDPNQFCTETTTKSLEIPLKIDTLISSNSISTSNGSMCFTEPMATIEGTNAIGSVNTPAYGWEVSTDNINFQTFTPSVTSKDYLPQRIVGERFYRRVVYSKGTCRNDTSNRVRVFVDTLVDPGLITGNPLGSFQCKGDSIVITSGQAGTGGTGNVRYTWEYNIPGQKWFPLSDVSEGLFIKDKKVLDNSGTIITFRFRRTAISGGGECRSTSDSIEITVCQDPIVKDTLLSGSVCAGETIGNTILTQGNYSPNGNVLVVDFTPLKTPKNGSIKIENDNGTWKYTYTPTDPLFIGLDTVIFKVMDPVIGRFTPKRLFITYYPVNHEPVVIRDLLPTYRNQPILDVNILGNDSDPDGDTLYVYPASDDLFYYGKRILPDSSYIRTSLITPKKGKVTVYSNGDLTYEPDKDLALRETVYDTAVFWVCDYSRTKYCNEFFCKRDTVIFEIKPYRIFVPDGYSPNDDGVNDYFVIRSEVPLDIELKVYNRWGNLVYENSHYKNDWNGKANRGLVIGEGLPDGTYYIHYDVHDILQEPGFKYITISR